MTHNPNDCRDCGGTGRVFGVSNPFGDYCPRCNGTGMAATHGWVVIVALLISIIAFVGLSAWALT